MESNLRRSVHCLLNSSKFHSTKQSNLLRFRNLVSVRRRFCSDNGNGKLIESSPRRYNNIHINFAKIESSDTRSNDEIFNDMQYSLKKWKENKVRGIWLYLPSIKSELISTFVKQFKFDFHHCGCGFVVLSKWMDETQECKFPPTPNTQLAVAGITLNKKNELLVIQEKYNYYDKLNIKWKFPGGLVDPFEDINDGSIREVFEETGIKTQFHSILGMRHQHAATLGGSKTKISDLYIGCHLSPLTDNLDINICQSEVKAAKWINIEEFLEKEEETWPINIEFAKVLYNGLKSNNFDTKTSNNTKELLQNNNIAVCGLIPKQLDSVSVPGTKYHLFLNKS